MLARQFDALLAAVEGAVPESRVSSGATGHGETHEGVHDGATSGDHDATTGHDEAHDDTTTDHDDATEGGHPDRESGVAFDGLHVWQTDEGYGFETPRTTATDLSREELRSLADGSPYVTNWYFWEWDVRRHGKPKRAFLRRAEAAAEHAPPERYDALADGMVTEWGQLRIEATVGEHGIRAYEIRHVDEADAARDALTAYDDPLAARDVAETDADDRYRPLKTAPSLAGGWVFPDLDWRDAVATVEEFYPATVANWHREQQGTLDVDHWRDTAERQTGIYDIVEELEPAAVDRIAASCCTDSQCLKRREWQYDEETELAADGGAGAFPCREPCSLVVAAARKWTTLERETERTYEFTLTPSEKEQLEALIDSVAEGRVDAIREADVYEGANRYRTRYLREKRMVDGDLCGVPTDPDDEEHADDGHDESDEHADDGHDESDEHADDGHDESDEHADEDDHADESDDHGDETHADDAGEDHADAEHDD